MRKPRAFLTHSFRGSSRWALCCVVWGPVVRQGIMVRAHDRAKLLTQQWLRSGEERKGQGPLQGRGATAVHQHHQQGTKS